MVDLKNLVCPKCEQRDGLEIRIEASVRLRGEYLMPVTANLTKIGDGDKVVCTKCKHQTTVLQARHAGVVQAFKDRGEKRTFIVTSNVDAYVVYTALVEGYDADEIQDGLHDGSIEQPKWVYSHTSEMDHTDIDVNEVEPAELETQRELLASGINEEPDEAIARLKKRVAELEKLCNDQEAQLMDYASQLKEETS